MNVLVLLGCFALASCVLGVLGIARVSKDRRGLKCYERECLLALDPLSLPPQAPFKSQVEQQQYNNNASGLVAKVVRSLARMLISPLLLLAPPLQMAPTATARVEQGPSPANPAADRIWDFIRQAALQLSGLSLLMANQHELPSAKPAVVMVDKSQSNNSAEHEQHHASKIHEGPQPTWTDEDAAGDQYDSFEGDGSRESDSDNDGASSDSNGDDGDDEGDDADEDEIFEDPFEQEEDEDAVAAESDAQRVLFDGLQFYTVLSQVGAAMVQSVVQQALLNTTQSATTKHLEQQQQASISAIEQRYPDIMCLSAPSYHLQHTTRADLATALLAVTAAAAAIQQSHQQQHPAQHCGTMERRLSIKRPDALAAEDGMEPMRRTPLTSPAASSNQLETSFLQAA